MADFASQATVALNSAFQNRVAISTYTVAREVLKEDKTVHGYDQRYHFARSVLNSDISNFIRLSSLVVSDSNIKDMNFNIDGSIITDDQIVQAIYNSWNYLSGVMLE